MTTITPNVYDENDFVSSELNIAPAEAIEAMRDILANPEQMDDKIAAFTGVKNIPDALVGRINLGEVIAEVQTSVSEATGIPVSELTKPIPTSEQAITTDLVFAMFASLCPDSPWAARLLKVQELFNQMGGAICEAMDNADITEALERGYHEDDKGSVTYAHAVSKLHEVHAALNPVHTPGAL